MQGTQERINGNDSVCRKNPAMRTPYTGRTNDELNRTPSHGIDVNAFDAHAPSHPRGNLEPLRMREPVLENVAAPTKHGRSLKHAHRHLLRLDTTR